MISFSYSVLSKKKYFVGIYESFNNKIDLDNLSSKRSSIRCYLDGTELKIKSLYIYRRKGNLTSISVDLVEDVWDFVKDKKGSEVIIKWESDSFIGEFANALVQNVTFSDNGNKNIKIYCFRQRNYLTERLFTINNIQVKRYEYGKLNEITCPPLPELSPEDEIIIDGESYLIDYVKITVDPIKSKMLVGIKDG